MTATTRSNLASLLSAALGFAMIGTNVNALRRLSLSAVSSPLDLLRRVLRVLVGAVLVYQMDYVAYVLVDRPATVAKLPGPGPEAMRGPLGHMTGPLFFAPGEPYSVEAMTRRLVGRLTKLARDYRKEGLMRLLVAWRTPLLNNLGLIVVTDARIARELLAAKNQPDYEKGIMYAVSAPLIGESVLRTSGPTWAAQRPVIEKGFSHSVMESAVGPVLHTVNELTQKWTEMAAASHNTAHVDVAVEMLKLTMDVIARAAFSYDVGSVAAKTDAEAPLYEPFQRILFGLNERGQSIWLNMITSLPTEKNRKLDSALAKLDAIVEQVLVEQRTRLGRDPHRKPDLLDVLVEAAMSHAGMTPEAASVWNHQTLKDNLKTMLFAGHDTSGFLYLP